MVYNFDIDVAREYGVDEAIMITNFQYWIMKKKASNKQFYDCHYWTYNSPKAFVEFFPFWNQRHIELVLKKLIEKGVLMKGNYNKSAYDRTLWYAFVDEKKWIYNKDEIHLQKNVNGNQENCKPIPDNKPNNKTDRENENQIASNFLPPSEDEVLDYAKKMNEMAGCGGFKCDKITALEFYSRYKSNGWILGNGIPMRDWQATLKLWCLREAVKK